MSSDLDKAFTEKQEELRAEARSIFDRPFYSKPQRLYKLYFLQSLESDQTKREICKLWNQEQEKPEYKDFKDDWMNPRDEEDRRRVESTYRNCCVKILILERIAELNNVKLERTREWNLTLTSYE